MPDPLLARGCTCPFWAPGVMATPKPLPVALEIGTPHLAPNWCCHPFLAGQHCAESQLCRVALWWAWHLTSCLSPLHLAPARVFKSPAVVVAAEVISWLPPSLIDSRLKSWHKAGSHSSFLSLSHFSCKFWAGLGSLSPLPGASGSVPGASGPWGYLPTATLVFCFHLLQARSRYI